MNLPTTYVRARSAEQKEERRRHLLVTARLMLSDTPKLLDLGLNELARTAGMTKSNVYRYFESVEAVLMDVLVEEFVGWQLELRAALARRKLKVTAEHIAWAFSETIAARPLLCRLTSILPSILERNVSLERMVGFKRNLLAVQQQAALDFHSSHPAMSVRAFEQLIRHALPLLIGLWPLSHPSEVSAQVLAQPGLESLRYEFRSDFERGLLTLLSGLATVQEPSG